MGAEGKWDSAETEAKKAIQLDPKSAQNYLSRGVGYYYLPSAFGGGVERAIPDFQKAIELNPKLAEAQLWLGVALRPVALTGGRAAGPAAWWRGRCPWFRLWARRGPSRATRPPRGRTFRWRAVARDRRVARSGGPEGRASAP